MIPKAYTPAWAGADHHGVPRAPDHPYRTGSSPITRTKRTGVRIIVGAGHEPLLSPRYELCGLIQYVGVLWFALVRAAAAGRTTSAGEELRPQTGWQRWRLPLDWRRPARHMNSTSCFYAKPLQPVALRDGDAEELLSPMADKNPYSGHRLTSMCAPNVWRGAVCPSARLGTNPLYGGA